MFSIQTKAENPYGDSTKGFISRQFPKLVIRQGREAVDCIIDALVATGRIRFGPRPRASVQARMETVVANYVSEGKPIPIQIPWGARKPWDDAIPDVAELAALKTLTDLQGRVKSVYSPGASMVIRMEDSSGISLTREKWDQSVKNVIRYKAGMRALYQALGMDDFVYFFEESSVISPMDFMGASKRIEPLMERYLLETDIYGLASYRERDSYQALACMGWSGEVPLAARETYYASHLYDGLDHEGKVKLLARYFSGALVRKQAGAKGTQPYWGEYLTLSFAKPIPGNEENLYLYYRTAPENETRTHIPPWRAKGYLIHGETETHLHLVSPKEIPNNLYRDETVLVRDDRNATITAKVSTDYQIGE